MNRMTLYQPKVPIPPQFQRHLGQQFAQIDYYHQLALQAMNAESDLYGYAVWKVVSSVAAATQLKKVFTANSTNPKVDAWFQEFTQAYMDEVAQVPKRVCGRILLILEATPPAPNDSGLLDELIAVFRRHL